MADDDPYAAIATPVASDPYASIATPIPDQGVRDRITAAVNDPSNVPDTGWRGQIENFGQGAAQMMNAAILHPVQTAISGANALMAAPSGSAAGTPGIAMTGNQTIDAQNAQAVGDAQANQAQVGKQMAANPANTAGQLAGGFAAAHVLPAVVGSAGAAGRVVAAAGTGLRDAAIGNPDAAALRGLNVPASSPKAQQVIKAVQGSRPYLQGVNSLSDLQAAIPVAKDEIIAPYRQAVDALSNKPVMGPDGPTTVGALDAQRSQLSAQLRTLKNGGPEAIQLATQKGMTQAELLQRQQDVQNALYPHLEETGINPREIMSRYSNVAQVGSKVAGKSTLNETPQKYGIGRATNLSIKEPLKAPVEVGLGLRDILAGRPLWSGSPTDIGIREAFRPGVPTPNLGKFTPPAVSVGQVQPARPRLESNVPANADFTSPVDTGSYPARPTVVTPQPVQVRQLPAQAGPTSSGEPSGQPAPSYPPLNEPTAQLNVNAGTPRPAQEEIPQRTIQVNPQGQAAIQRPALPAPETHAFSQKAWQAQHPNGNLKTAIKQATAKGYRVVD
jgi:hypothetical protein